MDPLRILVVDDESALTSLLEKYLQRMGFEVESASDPHLALERFRAAKIPFRLVLADLTMPGLSGDVLLSMMLRSDPNVVGILSSGYPAAGESLKKEYGGRIAFLQKPFLPRMLAETINRLTGTSHSVSSRAI
jgi:DNA-binding NtrC family response regulator